MRSKNIEVFIIAALSADGFIAQNAKQNSTHWTSREDGRFFQKKTKRAGVVIMGRTTFATIGRPLPQRLNVVYTRRPQLLNKQTEKESLRYTDLPPQELISQLAREGYRQVAVCGGRRIYTMFLESGVVDKLYLTIEPILFGQGISLFNRPFHQKLTLLATHQLSSQTHVREYALQP